MVFKGPQDCSKNLITKSKCLTWHYNTTSLLVNLPKFNHAKMKKKSKKKSNTL